MKEKPQKSQRLVSFEEFVAGRALKRVFLAGFKKYVIKEHKTLYMTDTDWAKVLSEYKNR